MTLGSVVHAQAQNKAPKNLPHNPSFSSGPCPKRPGWHFDHIAKLAFVGRSHRAAGPKAQIAETINKMHTLLGLPADYRLGIVPASDTGAFEMAIWSLLGVRPVDVFAWESFGLGWATDIQKELGLDTRLHQAPYGALADFSKGRLDSDWVFTWNGTTSGVCMPHADLIPDDRLGLTLVDATSAVFAQNLDWKKIDVATFSWQKVLGGEAAHGVIVLSPRAVKRLESTPPPRPLPKIFRLTKNGKLIEGIFKGETINTVSMIAIADILDALDWAFDIGGPGALQKRADKNFKTLQDWVDSRGWIKNLVDDPAIRSNTSVCLEFTDPTIQDTAGFSKAFQKILSDAHAAYDIGSYRDAPPGLRIWCGATVESSDIALLTQWLDYAYATLKQNNA